MVDFPDPARPEMAIIIDLCARQGRQNVCQLRGQGRLEGFDFAAWQSQRQLGSVQKDAAEIFGFDPFDFIEGVTNQGMTQGMHVHADLVGASGFDGDFNRS